MRKMTGDYEGASEFAHFNAPVAEMSEREMRDLLTQILLRATAGIGEAPELMFAELERAEERAECGF